MKQFAFLALLIALAGCNEVHTSKAKCNTPVETNDAAVIGVVSQM